MSDFSRFRNIIISIQERRYNDGGYLGRNSRVFKSLLRISDVASDMYWFINTGYDVYGISIDWICYCNEFGYGNQAMQIRDSV